MKSLIPILAALALTTSASASEQWRSKPVLCETNEAKAQQFYAENNLYPMMVGAGVAANNLQSMQQVPVVTYVLYNEEENYMMVVEYQQSEICILAVGAGVSFDVEQLEGFLGSN